METYVVLAGRLPKWRRRPFWRARWERALQRTPGVINVFDMQEQGTLIVFDNYPNAERARRAMENNKNLVCEEVMSADYDEENRFVQVHGGIHALW